MLRTTTPENAKRWHKLLEQSQYILLAAPTGPDGDSVGAQLALKELIQAHWKGKQVFPYHEEAVADRYDSVPGAKDIFHKATAGSIPFNKLDVCIILDGGKERVGDFLNEKLSSQTAICQIDHHAVEGGFPYKERWCDGHCSSTGELVYRLLTTPPFDERKMTSAMAQALYVSLIFDTGFFRHDSTSPETLRIAAKLYEQKIPFSDLAEKTMLHSRFESKKLAGIALSNMELHFQNRVVLTCISQSDFRSVNATEDDKDGIIEQIFLTRGVEVGALIVETRDGKSKASFRSRTDFDVATFARSLAAKGGGHRKASGCTMDLPLKEARMALLNGLGQDARFQS